MENIRKIKNIELVSDLKRAKKLVFKPQFKDRIIYTENICAIGSEKSSYFFDKAIFVGLAILEVSKFLMYDFHYNVMVKKCNNNISMCYMDTGGIIYDIQTDDIYRDMCTENLSTHFDTSDYPVHHFCYSFKNKKVIGKFKDECEGNSICEFVGLREKCILFVL